MNLHLIFTLAIGLSLFLAVNSRDVRDMNFLEMNRIEKSTPQERNISHINQGERRIGKREIITRTSLEAYTAENDKTNNFVNLGKSTLEGVGALIKLDYSQSGEEIAWAVANAVVPIIAAGLAFIPVVGVIVSGLFLGVWSIISAIFAPKQENPMEKMINELAVKMRKEMDDKLSNIINLAIHGEIARNTYICNKYSYISNTFSKKFKTNTTLEPIDAVKLTVYFNDCDNFLKDTSEAFVYDDYADVLWIPGAITTSARLGFLAELIQYGPLMRLTEDVIVMYFHELRNEIDRQFEYHIKGLNRVAERNKETKFSKNINYLVNITTGEMAACKLQGQFYYFDRQLYPYGMPTILNNTDLFADIKLEANFNKTQYEATKVQHIQIFFNVTGQNLSKLPKRERTFYEVSYFALEFMNCFHGPTYLKAPNIMYFNFHFMPENNQYSYEFRVMYLEKTVYNTTEVTYAPKEFIPVLDAIEKGQRYFKEYESVHRRINPRIPLEGKTCLSIEFVEKTSWRAKNSKKLVDVPSKVPWKNCPYADRDYTGCKKQRVPCAFDNNDIEICQNFTRTFQGRFKMYSAGVYNHREETLNPLIWIDDPRVTYNVANFGNVRYEHTNGFLMGLEVIVRPVIDMWK